METVQVEATSFDALALAQLEALWNAPIGLVFFDRALRCVRVNRAMLELDGRPLEAHLGRTWNEMLPALEQVLATGRARTAVELRAGDGGQGARWWLMSCFPVRDDTGELMGVGASVVDLTGHPQDHAQRVADEARRRASLHVEESHRLKDEFLATVTHELRTPLSAITGWLHMLQAKALPPFKQERALGAIERNARQLTQLVDDLLDISQLISGKQVVGSAPTALDAVVDAAVESVRPAAEEKGLRVEVRCAAPGLQVCGDPMRLGRVVWHLLSNALKFTPQHGTVSIEVEEADGWAKVRVRDTGQGISPDFLPRVFDRFRQADGTARRVHGGMGLGLAFVRHVTEAHGGTVTAQSAGEGSGATFTVSLPTV